MPQNTRMIATIAALLFAPAAFAAGPVSVPQSGPGYGPGTGTNPGMTRGACMGIMRTLTPEQHAMHFHDMKMKMDTLTVTKFRAWKRAECDKLSKDPAARDSFTKDLQARWDKLSDKEKLAAYHDILARKAMRPGPRHGKHPGKQGMNRTQGWK